MQTLSGKVLVRHVSAQERHCGQNSGGVWVIVGMALFFVIGGLGIGAFIAWKAISGRTLPSEADEAGSERAKVAPAVADASSSEAGVVTSEATDRRAAVLPGGGARPIESSKIRCAKKY